jgi:hypothetical protein
MFDHYAELPKNILDRLIVLKHEIERIELEQGNYTDLLNSYYEEIDKAWFLINDPLPPKYELKQGLMPEYYYDFLEEYKHNGPFNFLSQCQGVDIIALINIKSVKRNNEKLFINVIEIFKGKRESFVPGWFGNIKISYNSFMDDCNRFKHSKKAIALIHEFKDDTFSSDNRLFISISNCLLPIFLENDIEVAGSVRYDESYWRNINLSKTRVSDMTHIPLSALTEWFRVNASNLTVHEQRK